jgi:CRISPR-associated protein Cmr2
MFQIGPVQDFIAQARKTLDLWSGSYLLSYLIAQGMLAVAEGGVLDGTEVQGVGPDAIVFPQLRSVPLADLHWSEKGVFGGLKLRASHKNERLVPNLPNRFLALVPAHRAADLARFAENTIRSIWGGIADSVRRFIDETVGGQCPGWDRHWDAQVSRFPVIDWIVHPWPDTRSALKRAGAGVPPSPVPWEENPLNLAAHWARRCIPEDHRESYGPESTSGFAWSIHFATADWKLAARKNARSFPPWRVPGVGEHEADGVPKDHLDGRSEVLGGDRHETFWSLLREKQPGVFKGSQLYGALSVIKRLWPQAYLGGVLRWERWRPEFESVPEIARIERGLDDNSDNSEIYYAVIAMDGDDMGQWVSGAKAAPLVHSLADEAKDYFRRHWKAPAGDRPEADKVPRPLSPGYHAALSEALAHFSLYCAGPIVNAFKGLLIYAGGDDVLAMTPARNALDCAQALQLAFRGVNPDAPESQASEPVRETLKSLFDYSRHVDGFLTLKGSDVGAKSHLKPNWPLMVPGPLVTVSCGIAIGHIRSPMQDTIQAARDAEAAAKQVEGKGAFSLRVLKRSGESVGFSARWASPVIGVWEELQSRVHDLSGRFAHRYASLLKPLVLAGASSSGDPESLYEREWRPELIEAAEAELGHALHRQGGLSAAKARELAALWSPKLTGALPPRDHLHFWLTWAFLRRI